MSLLLNSAKFQQAQNKLEKLLRESAITMESICLSVTFLCIKQWEASLNVCLNESGIVAEIYLAVWRFNGENMSYKSL